MSKKKNKLSLIQKAQNKFKKFKSLDLDYRTILSEALALIYKIHKSVSDDELENECKKANLNYNQERKLLLILELCVPKPDDQDLIERYKARLRTYARGLEVFIRLDVDKDIVKSKLRAYGIEFFANPRDKDDEYIKSVLSKKDNNNEPEGKKKVRKVEKKLLSERTVSFFTRNNVHLNSAIIFMVGNNVYCSNDDALIDKLKEFKRNSEYEFNDIDFLPTH